MTLTLQKSKKGKKKKNENERFYADWTGRLLHQPGVPHLYVNRPLNGRCLKLKVEQLKIHFHRKPSSG